MFNLSDQLNGSFIELMEELRAIRQELELIRAQLNGQSPSAPATLRPVRKAATRARKAPARKRSA